MNSNGYITPFLTATFLSLASIVCAEVAGADQDRLEGELSSTLIRNVKVFDGVNDTVVDASVLVEGNLIKAIGPGLVAPKDATIIDGGGRTLIPGLIDGHNHLSLVGGPLALAYQEHWSFTGAIMAREAKRTLMRGFTTVRDAGGPVYGLAKAIDKGEVAGPRVYPSGHFITQTSGHFDFRLPNDTHHRQRSSRSFYETDWAFIADGVPEVRAACREVLRLGATQIKVSLGGGNATPYDPLDTTHYSHEEIKAAVEAAEDWNTYVLVHAYTDESVMRALKAGVKCIDHGNLIMEEETIVAIKEAGAFLCPQVLIFTPDEEMLAAGDPHTIAKGAPIRNNVDLFMRLVRKHEVPIAFGVDIFGTPELLAMQNLELTRRLKWFTPAQVLRQATSNTATMLAQCGPRNPYPDGPLGVIKEGAYADLLLVDGDPLEDLALLEDPEKNLVVIMKDGRIYKNTIDSQGRSKH